MKQKIMDMTKRGIAMVSAVTEALRHRTKGQIPDEEVVMKKTMKFVSNPEFKEYQFKMVSAVSHAIKILQAEPDLSDRQVIDRIVKEMTNIGE
jgi:hypothetical protein